MYRGRYQPHAGGEQLALLDAVADTDQMPSRCAYVLLQRYEQKLRHRQNADWRIGGKILATFRMYAATEFEQFHTDLPPGRPKGGGSPLGEERKKVSWGLFIWPPPVAPSTTSAMSPAAQPCVWPRWDTRQRTCRRRYRPP